MIQPRIGLITGLFIYALLIRLIPYLLYRFPNALEVVGIDIDANSLMDPSSMAFPWNFSPLGAMCLFGAACFTNRYWAFLLPLGVHIVSDFGIWALSGQLAWGFGPGAWLAMGCLALTVTLGFYLRNNRSIWAVGGTGLLGAVMFFLITNFGVWALGGGVRYPMTFAGLIECYTMALPFFRNSLISMTVFLPVLFSRFCLVESKLSALVPVPVTAIK
jgi:hypothetical protein